MDGWREIGWTTHPPTYLLDQIRDVGPGKDQDSTAWGYYPSSGVEQVTFNHVDLGTVAEFCWGEVGGWVSGWVGG